MNNLAETAVYTVGQAAKLSGVSAANIRFYEAEGLVAARSHGDNGYRLFGEAEVHTLKFIRRLRCLDMSLDEVRSLVSLDLRKKADCASARHTLDEHLQHVRTRLQELRHLERELADLRGRCDGSAPKCHLIEALHQQADAPQKPVVKKRHAPL
jgi:DNA-binding transcriptional MerR regulator